MNKPYSPRKDSALQVRREAFSTARVSAYLVVAATLINLLIK